MKVINQFILFLLFFFVNNQVPDNYAINSCGKITNYTQPVKKDDCVDNTGEICCYVYLKSKTSDKVKKFCASAPVKITKDDIVGKIENFTNYTLEELECLNSKYLKNIFGTLKFLSINLYFTIFSYIDKESV